LRLTGFPRVFAAVIRYVETGALTKLRDGMLELEDPPAAIEIVERELRIRNSREMAPVHE
jgi:hypothetical protein